MEKTDKRLRFERVASNRVQRILDTLALLQNCSNRNNSEYSESDVERMFAEIAKKLRETKATYAKELQKTEPHITDVRGRGLMIGIDLDIPHKDVRQPLIYQEHCFTGCAGTNILRLLPPLCLTRQDADDFMNRLKKTL